MDLTSLAINLLTAAAGAIVATVGTIFSQRRRIAAEAENALAQVQVAAADVKKIKAETDKTNDEALRALREDVGQQLDLIRTLQGQQVTATELALTERRAAIEREAAFKQQVGDLTQQLSAVQTAMVEKDREHTLASAELHTRLSVCEARWAATEAASQAENRRAESTAAVVVAAIQAAAPVVAAAAAATTLPVPEPEIPNAAAS